MYLWVSVEKVITRYKFC